MTETEIANFALDQLGEAPITALSDATPVARALNRNFATARDAVLRMHRWNFAIRRVELSALAAAPAFRYAYAYALPDDCIRPLEAENDGAFVEYEIESGSLVTQSEVAELLYVARETDVSTWPADFAECVGYKLASQVAVALTSSFEKKQAMEQSLRALALPDAQFADANETKPRVILPSDRSRGLRARRTYGGASTGKDFSQYDFENP